MHIYIFALVKLYICCCTTFYTFQDLFEHTFMYNHVIYKFFPHLPPTLCNKTTSPLLFSFIYLISGLSFNLKNHCQYSKFNKIMFQTFHCKEGDIAVYEYANWHICPWHSFGAQIQPLCKRPSPQSQYANVWGQGWSCAMSSSRFHTINTPCVHTSTHFTTDIIEITSPALQIIPEHSTIRLLYKATLLRLRIK